MTTFPPTDDQIADDYEWMTGHGATHEEAARRLNISADDMTEHMRKAASRRAQREVREREAA